jgi:hypothetical protein
MTPREKAHEMIVEILDCIEPQDATLDYNYERMVKLIEAALKERTEECAKIAEDSSYGIAENVIRLIPRMETEVRQRIAAAIRGRSEESQ